MLEINEQMPEDDDGGLVGITEEALPWRQLRGWRGRRERLGSFLPLLWKLDKSHS